jgi:hypothetical protein
MLQESKSKATSKTDKCTRTGNAYLNLEITYKQYRKTGGRMTTVAKTNTTIFS